MHEMSLCESVLQVIEEQAAVQGYTKVVAVYLEVGALAGVEVEALRFGFDVVMKGTVADGARLEIIHQAGQAWCRPCNKLVEIAQRFDACPDCGAYELELRAGEALRVKELEVV